MMNMNPFYRFHEKIICNSFITKINKSYMYLNIHEIGNDIRFISFKKIFHFYGKYKKDILEID